MKVLHSGKVANTKRFRWLVSATYPKGPLPTSSVNASTKIHCDFHSNLLPTSEKGPGIFCSV